MKLTEEVKKQITDEFESFKKDMYAGKSREERKKLGQFFTPAAISIQMIEKFDCESFAGKTILDPTCGSGNLLAACLIAGADSDKVFGNEFDLDLVYLCRDRLNSVCKMLGKPYINDWQIHHGDAKDVKCLTNFGPDYVYGVYDEVYEPYVLF